MTEVISSMHTTQPVKKAIFWHQGMPFTDCEVGVDASEHDIVSIYLRDTNEEWELNLTTAEARRLIYAIHRVVIETLNKDQGGSR